MEESAVIASSVERATLERLEKYLSHLGVTCRVQTTQSGKFALSVPGAEVEKARRVLEDLARGTEADSDEEVVEIRCNESERTEISAWLQILIDEHDKEGSPVFFHRAHYEALLDALLSTGQAEAPVFLLRGLVPFLPEGSKRLVMGPALQDFFRLIEAVSSADEG